MLELPPGPGGDLKRSLWTVGSDPVIMAGAKVLGPIEVGRGWFVGANAVLAPDGPEGKAYPPGSEVRDSRERVAALERRIVELDGQEEPARRRLEKRAQGV